MQKQAKSNLKVDFYIIDGLDPNVGWVKDKPAQAYNSGVCRVDFLDSVNIEIYNDTVIFADDEVPNYCRIDGKYYRIINMRYNFGSNGSYNYTAVLDVLDLIDSNTSIKIDTIKCDSADLTAKYDFLTNLILFRDTIKRADQINKLGLSPHLIAFLDNATPSMESFSLSANGTMFMVGQAFDGSFANAAYYVNFSRGDTFYISYGGGGENAEFLRDVKVEFYRTGGTQTVRLPDYCINLSDVAGGSYIRSISMQMSTSGGSTAVFNSITFLEGSSSMPVTGTISPSMSRPIQTDSNDPLLNWLNQQGRAAHLLALKVVVCPPVVNQVVSNLNNYIDTVGSFTYDTKVFNQAWREYYEAVLVSPFGDKIPLPTHKDTITAITLVEAVNPEQSVINIQLTTKKGTQNGDFMQLAAITYDGSVSYSVSQLNEFLANNKNFYASFDLSQSVASEQNRLNGLFGFLSSIVGSPNSYPISSALGAVNQNLGFAMSQGLARKQMNMRLDDLAAAKPTTASVGLAFIAYFLNNCDFAVIEYRPTDDELTRINRHIAMYGYVVEEYDNWGGLLSIPSLKFASVSINEPVSNNAVIQRAIMSALKFFRLPPPPPPPPPVIIDYGLHDNPFTIPKQPEPAQIEYYKLHDNNFIMPSAEVKDEN